MAGVVDSDKPILPTLKTLQALSTNNNNNSLLLSVSNLQSASGRGETATSGQTAASDMEPKACQKCALTEDVHCCINSTDVGQVVSLQGALASLQAKLTQKDIEVARLSRIRDDVEAELEELTASLFEEAHRMVREANVKQASAEKGLVEANMKIDGLETEVSALKTLVITSTPSQPNKHLHPQLGDTKRNGSGKKQKDEANKPQTSPGPKSPSAPALNGLVNGTFSSDVVDHADANASGTSPPRNMDPLLRSDYLSWRKAPSSEPTSHPFVARIFAEDVEPCLRFPNSTLAVRTLAAIRCNGLCLSPVKDFSNVPRNCALLEQPVLCRYLLKLTDPDSTSVAGQEEFFVSQLARNRLAAVCDCLTYLRYVEQGLVKAHVNDVYWEIMRLRKQMACAKLGFNID